jgi:hypothetical protein
MDLMSGYEGISGFESHPSTRKLLRIVGVKRGNYSLNHPF